MKVCSQCKEKKSLDNFYKLNGAYYAMCNPCKAKYNKDRYAKIRRRVLKNQW